MSARVQTAHSVAQLLKMAGKYARQSPSYITAHNVAFG